MNINEFALLVADKEKGKKELPIGQIKEVLKVTKNLLKEATGFDLYKEIRKAEDY